MGGHGNNPSFVQRWNLQHRLQHATLAISMVGLIWTGLAIRYHYVGWAQWTFEFFGGFHNNLIVHKASASLLVAVSVWHLIYLLVHWPKEKDPRKWAMMPGLNDLRDVWHHILYLLQVRKTPPQYGRYSYLEKFEYLAIFWGMVVMGLTGFSLWFPAEASQFFNRTMLDVFRIIHSHEAVVAVITLAYGHFFTVHFNPAIFPSNPVWLTGKLSLEHFIEEHPAEYQQMVAEGKLPPMAAGASHEHKLPAWRRAVAGLELIIYSAVFYYLLVTFIPLLLA